MTVPPYLSAATGKVSDMVRSMFTSIRRGLSGEEQRLGLLLRGNKELHGALCGFIRARIEARASVQEPADPVECKSMIARDRELRWLLGRLDFMYRAPNPVVSESEDGEQPA